MEAKQTSRLRPPKSENDPTATSATSKDIWVDRTPRLPDAEFRQLHCLSLILRCEHETAGVHWTDRCDRVEFPATGVHPDQHRLASGFVGVVLLDR